MKNTTLTQEKTLTRSLRSQQDKLRRTQIELAKSQARELYDYDKLLFTWTNQQWWNELAQNATNIEIAIIGRNLQYPKPKNSTVRKLTKYATTSGIQITTEKHKNSYKIATAGKHSSTTNIPEYELHATTELIQQITAINIARPSPESKKQIKELRRQILQLQITIKATKRQLAQLTN